MPAVEERVDRLELALIHLSKEIAKTSAIVANTSTELDKTIRTVNETAIFHKQFEARMDKWMQKTDEKLEQSKKEFEEWKQKTDEKLEQSKREFEEWKQKTDEKLEQSKREFEEWKQKTDEKLEQSKREFEEWKQKTDEKLEQSKRDLEAWKLQNKKDNQKWNHEMAVISRRLSRLVEDFVIPSIPKILEKRFKLKINTMYAQIKRKHPITDLTIEYDALIDTNEYFFINSTKSQLRIKDIDSLEESFPVFREYFPEHKGRELAGILSTFKPEKHVLDYATKKGFIVMGLGEWLMKLKNKKVELKAY